MTELIETLLIASVPAIVTGIIAYLKSRSDSKLQIKNLSQTNKHELDKLMKQHQIDIDSLKEKHVLETQKNEIEHKYKLEIMEAEALKSANFHERKADLDLKSKMLEELIKNPDRMDDFTKMANKAGKINQKKLNGHNKSSKK